MICYWPWVRLGLTRTAALRWVQLDVSYGWTLVSRPDRYRKFTSNVSLGRQYCHPRPADVKKRCDFLKLFLLRNAVLYSDKILFHFTNKEKDSESSVRLRVQINNGTLEHFGHLYSWELEGSKELWFWLVSLVVEAAGGWWDSHVTRNGNSPDSDEKSV